MPTTGLLVVYAKCARVPEEAEWNEWEDDVHVPALCAADGPWIATRFELTARPQPGMPGIGFTHVTIYELDDADVVAQAARTLDADGRAPRRGERAPCACRHRRRRVPGARPVRREARTVDRAAWPHPHQRALHRSGA